MEELLLFCPRMSDIEALNAIGVIELSDGSIVKIMSSTLPSLLEFSLTSGVSSALSTASASAPMNLAYPNDKSALLLHIETRNATIATTATSASASASDLYQLQEDEHLEECLNGRVEHSADQGHMTPDEYYASASEEHYSPHAHANNIMNMSNMNMSNMNMNNMNMNNMNMNTDLNMNMNMNMNDSLRMTVSTCSTDARLRTMDFENDTVFPAMDRDRDRDRDMGRDRDRESMNRNIQGHDIRTTHVLKIESYVIANHFKSLIRWTAELDLVSSPNENVFPFVLNIGDDIRQAFTLQTDIGLSTLSWGGDNNNTDKHHQGLNPCDNNQDSNDVNLLDQGMSAITLLIDTRLKSYTLTVCAPCAFELEFRVAGCVELVKILGEMSHRMTLTGKAFCISDLTPPIFFLFLRPIFFNFFFFFLFIWSLFSFLTPFTLCIPYLFLTMSNKITITLFFSALSLSDRLASPTQRGYQPIR